MLHANQNPKALRIRRCCYRKKDVFVATERGHYRIPSIRVSKAGYPQPKDEVLGMSCQLSVVSTGSYFVI